MAWQSLEQRLTVGGCQVASRHLDGPVARELFFTCQPPAESSGAGPQAEAVYRAVGDILSRNEGHWGSVVSETLFLRDADADAGDILASRSSVLSDLDAAGHSPATSIIEQPPLQSQSSFELLIQALIPKEDYAPKITMLDVGTTCNCSACSLSSGLLVRLGKETRLYMGTIYGRGSDCHEQALEVFASAQAMLQQAGMALENVIRTWIYLPDMERDYGGLNSARREFFAARAIVAPPASTGIGAGLVTTAHDIGLSLFAMTADEPLHRTVMTTPTLNEAPEYGSDFARGIHLDEANRISLHVSGTASIDERGATIHVGDLDSQVDRMLLNVASLLEGQGAGFGDVAYAITYLKDAADSERLREKFRKAGFEGFPNILVEAPVCRPDLLCEVELLALLGGE